MITIDALYLLFIVLLDSCSLPYKTWFSSSSKFILDIHVAPIAANAAKNVNNATNEFPSVPLQTLLQGSLIHIS